MNAQSLASTTREQEHWRNLLDDLSGYEEDNELSHSVSGEIVDFTDCAVVICVGHVGIARQNEAARVADAAAWVASTAVVLPVRYILAHKKVPVTHLRMLEELQGRKLLS